jgi:CHAD domain-containing protein
MAHARQVAEFAVFLFDLTDDVHDLAPEQRGLVYQAGLLHNVGLSTDPAAHHKAGRDILLKHPLTDLGDQERQMLACVARFHRKKVQPGKEPAFQSLPAEAQEDTLTIAALVRMADGLDYSQGQATRLGEPLAFEEGFTIPVLGPYAGEDAARAQEKADLWHRLFDFQLRFVSEGDVLHMDASDLAPAITEPAPETPGILPGDPMSEAGRKVLRFHFRRMRRHEPGTRLGQDIEELHDMRVATRRMRSAARIFGPYFDRKAFAPHLKGLRRAGQTLGAVRDLDVLLLKTQSYTDNLPADQRDSLRPLLDAWRAKREAARQQMTVYLDSEGYAEFAESFGAFLAIEGTGVAEPTTATVSEGTPLVIYERLAAVRAYAPLLAYGDQADIPTLHALRIAFKRLRYALEFFREVLGPEADDVIAVAVEMQDHLGDLHDADVACGLIVEFLNYWHHARPVGVRIEGVAAYLVERQAEMTRLVETAPAAWSRFEDPALRRKLALAVGVL